MPKVKDKMTGEVVAEMAYNNEGIQAAENAADNNPNLEVDYATTDAANRSEVTYLGGGSIPQYKKGGSTKKSIGEDLSDWEFKNLDEASAFPRTKKSKKKQIGTVGDKKKEAPTGAPVGTVGDSDDIFDEPELIGTYPKKKKSKKKKKKSTETSRIKRRAY